MTKAIATKVIPNYQFFQLLMKKTRKVMKFDSCREEKALSHVAMVPKVFDDNKPIKPLRDCAIIIWRGGSKISKVGLKIKLHPP